MSSRSKKAYRPLCSVCGLVMPGQPEKAWPHDDGDTPCRGSGRNVLWLRKARVLTDRQLVQSIARQPRCTKGSVRAASGGLPGLGRRP